METFIKGKTILFGMARKKDSRTKSLRLRLVSSLNKGLIPLEHSYKAVKKLSSFIKKSAPLAYGEIEHLIKSNLIPLNKKNKIFRKHGLADFGDTITSGLVKKFPSIDEQELKKIVKDRKSQTFIDIIAKGLSVREKEYAILPQEKKFLRILIANRGEIALRVMRACRELDIETVLVYSTNDKNTLPVKYADKAFCIGQAVSYLDAKKIIGIAKNTKSDAIHPGYGFLAENAKFAKLCEKSGIKFIGPKSKSIELLGDKVRAKKIAAKAKVPILPGTSAPLKNKKHALKVAKQIGYPVMIKAVAGGGGKGMRIVNNKDEIEKSYESAEAEAYLSFKDRTLYMEKYIEGPRHIEMQILGDSYGNIIYIGERDCSIQRKHQKLIEEAPSHYVSEDLREKMGDAAVKIAKAAKYEGVGTVEFLVDKNKNFHFIEVNTRIQVEHGVTEMVTGVDLVKEQIKIASGGVLALKQDSIKLEGHAIECRINAEDPIGGFVPSIGTIANYLPPGGPGIRVSSICHSGFKVLSDFDSLLSLLICHGSTRSEALSRMRRALHEYVISGIKTTIPFHLAVLHNKNFIKGNVTTSFIEKNSILQRVNDYCIKKENQPTKDEKVILITTTISKYMGAKNGSNKANAWVSAGRQEIMEKER